MVRFAVLTFISIVKRVLPVERKLHAGMSPPVIILTYRHLRCDINRTVLASSLHRRRRTKTLYFQRGAAVRRTMSRSCSSSSRISVRSHQRPAINCRRWLARLCRTFININELGPVDIVLRNSPARVQHGW